MTSTFDSGRSPISMVSFLSWECSDQAESDMSSREELQKRQQRPAPNAFPSSCTSPVSTCQSACFPALLAPNRDREIGGGRATRQPGQIRKEAALTRSGSGRSSVSYLFSSESRMAPTGAPRRPLSAKAGLERKRIADRSMTDAGAPSSQPDGDQGGFDLGEAPQA